MHNTDPAALGAEAAACVERYLSVGDVRELDRAVELYRASGRDRTAFENLAAVLFSRYEACGLRSDLDEARSVLVDLARSGPITAHHVSLLARAALYVYELDGDPTELERAIRTARFGLANAAPQDTALFDLNHALGSALMSRFDMTGQPDDLDEALRAHRVAADTATGVRRLGSLVNVVRQSRRKIELTASQSDTGLVAATVAAAEEVASGISRDHPLRGEMLHAAGVLLRYRYEATGDPADLHKSVTRLRQAVSLPGEKPDEHTLRLTSLSAALLRQFQAVGNRDLLTEAVEGNRLVLAATPVSDRERPVRLNNLAATLRERTLYFNDLDALREAIELVRESVTLATDSRNRAIFIGTLGVALQDLFARTEDPDAADEAVACAREAVQRGVVDRDDQRIALANGLTQRYQAYGDSADLAEALRLLHDLLEQLPVGSFIRHRCLGALGRAWRLEFERTGDLDALDRAITAVGRAIRADSVTAAVRALYRREFAELLLVQHDRVRAVGPLRSAADAFAAVAADSAVGPLHRVLAASRWADTAVRLEDWPRALEAARMAMSLLPEVAARRVARTDREDGIAQLSGVAADAAACALQADDAELAVRWLEQGRGVLLGQTLDTRSDVGELRRRHPDAAARLAELDGALAALDIAAARSDQRHTMAWQREELLGEIRALPGFAEFLLPPTMTQVHEWAGTGPVVLVNVSGYRCDALVLAGGALTAIPLPRLTLIDAARNADRFADALEASTVPGHEHEGGQAIIEILAWLDDCVTGPVLDRLVCEGARVWWSPGGPLASLPLHAAWRSGNGVLDRVISSYTPTVRALGHARSTAERPGRRAGLMTVAVSEPGGAFPLPYAYKEAAGVGDLWSATAFIGEDADPARVLDALGRHGYAHFACHGVYEPDDPSASRLLLHDRPLTVLEISRTHLTEARLAVLSACHTARGAPVLADEALHLAGAFQLAGYPSVVATLWKVNDMMASRIALAFHAALTAGGMPPAPDRAATALHEVLHQFRDYPPSIWAGWVHSGA